MRFLFFNKEKFALAPTTITALSSILDRNKKQHIRILQYNAKRESRRLRKQHGIHTTGTEVIKTDLKATKDPKTTLAVWPF